MTLVLSPHLVPDSEDVGVVVMLPSEGFSQHVMGYRGM